MGILLTFGTARVLLAGDAEKKSEEYMSNGPYTGPLTVSRFETTKRPELRFRALLDSDAVRVVRFERAATG